VADRPPIIARAFELAPQCASLKELTGALRREGYTSVESHLFGLGLQRQLRQRYKDGAGITKGPPKRTSG